MSLAMYTHHVLSVGPAVPDSVKTLKDFFAWTKANPDKAVYGSPGAGSMPHLIGVLLSKASGAELRHVAYRGSAPGIQDLLGGQIASFLGPAGDVHHAFEGRQGARARLLRRGARRLPARRADHARAGLRRSRCASGTPSSCRRAPSAEAVQRAAAALQQAIAQPDVVEFGKQFGLEVQSSTPRAARRPAQGATPPNGAASPRRPASPPTREPMTRRVRSVRLASQSVVAERRADGSVHLRSPQPLAAYPAQAHRAARPLGRARAGARVPRAARSGRRVARLTYAQARSRARRVAQALLERGLSAERPVAVLSGNDIEHALIELGALYAGVPYAPVSPAYSLLSKDFAKLRHVMRAAHAGAGLRFRKDRFRDGDRRGRRPASRSSIDDDFRN